MNTSEDRFSSLSRLIKFNRMGGEMKESQSKPHISLYICLYSTLISAFLMMDLDNEEDWAAKTWYTEKKHLTVL